MTTAVAATKNAQNLPLTQEETLLILILTRCSTQFEFDLKCSGVLTGAGGALSHKNLLTHKIKKSKHPAPSQILTYLNIQTL